LLLGYSESEVLRKPVEELIFPENMRPRLRAVLSRLPRSKTEVIALLTHTASGETVKFDWQFTWLEEEGQLVAALGWPVEREIVPLEFQHQLLECIHPEAAVLVDRGWRILDCNSTARAVYGSCVGRFCREFFPSRREWQRALHKAERQLAEEGRFVLRAALRSSTGKVIPMEIRGASLNLTGCLLLTTRDLSPQEQLRHTISHLEERLRVMGHRLLELQTRERVSIATEIHDKLAQELTILRWQALEVQAAGSREKIERCCQDMLRRIDALLGKTKELILKLRSAPYKELPFPQALKKTIASLQEAFRISCRLTMGEEIPDLRGSQRDAVLCILQEAVLNTVRHAQTDEVYVAVNTTDQGLVVEIRDEGVGMGEAELRAALSSPGIQGMLTRAAQVGGTLRLESAQGRGTRVTLTLPLDEMGESKGG